MEATGNALVEFLAFDSARLAQADMIFRIGLQFVLLAASAFFSGSETALFSLSRLDLQQLRRRQDPRFPTLHALLEQPRRLIISILCGNELINVAAAANMAGILVSLYDEATAAVLNILIMVPLLLLFGEVTPKTIAVSDPVKVSTRIIALPLSIWVRVIAPMRWLIRVVADRLTTWIVGEEAAAENILQIDEFRTLVDEVAKGGELSASERSMIYNLLEAGTTEVVEIMTPRTQTDFIDADMSVAEIAEQMRCTRHARVPVCRGTPDHLVGIIHAEDVLRYVLEDTDLNTLRLEDIMHPPIMVPLTKKVDEMLDFFVDNEVQAAAVLNEFGGVDGFVTMRRVLAFVFGQIAQGKRAYQEVADNIFEVAGDLKLNQFNDVTNFGISDPRMTTIGGVVLRKLDRLPREGDEVAVDDVLMTVLEMTGHRIARVRAARGVSPKQVGEADKASAETDADKPRA